MTTLIELHRHDGAVRVESMDPFIGQDMSRGSIYRHQDRVYTITRGKENPIRIGSAAPFMVARETREAD